MYVSVKNDLSREKDAHSLIQIREHAICVDIRIQINDKTVSFSSIIVIFICLLFFFNDFSFF